MSGLELLARLGELLRIECGLDLSRGGARWSLAEHVESRLAELSGAREQDLLERVLANVDGEHERLIHAITVRHTWFFRDPEQLDEVAEFLRLRHVQLGRTLDVWVAGCASGEEAWTLAMIADALGVAIRVWATDIDPRAIVEARIARYGEARLRELPATMLHHFESEGGGRWRVDVRALLGERCQVEFAVHNLCHPPPELEFDLICCRNVLIYLEAERTGYILEQLRTRLRAQGRLVLGGADRLADPNTWRSVEPRPLRSARSEPLNVDPPASVEPLQAEAEFWTGLAHHRAGRPEQAIAAFRRASCLTPELWPASLFAALAHEHRGDHRAAQRCWTALVRALERTPSPRIPASAALIAALPGWRSEGLALARLRSSRDLESKAKP